MSNLYSIVVKAKDGVVAVKAFDTEDKVNIAIAMREKSASVFTDSLPEELVPYRHNTNELIRRVRNILNDNSVKVYVRPMMAVSLNEQGHYVFELNGKSNILDGDHPELGARLAPVKKVNASARGARIAPVKEVNASPRVARSQRFQTFLGTLA